MSDDLDTDCTDNVVCPWCGHEHDCSWEFFDDGHESTEAECGECDKPFTASRDVSVTYSTKRKEPQHD